jgi:hypothetical protein
MKFNFKSTVFVLSGFVVATIPAVAQEVTITVKTGDQTEVEVKPDHAAPFEGVRPAVDVAILLDTSNSMDGLIDQAKTQLWTIVQQFARAEKNHQTPQLRVSVFEYGNSGLPASEGYIRQAVQLTDDLDKVSEALFSLKTNGGDEYCGTVIAEALKRLDWSEKDNSYKAIFIAGNEPFTQGSIDYRDSCKSAIEKGVVINTIHCGNYQTGISTKWKDGADLAEGEYMNIDQDRKTVHIETPHDEVIIRLNAELNKTYLWYGSHDMMMDMDMNQRRQDANAAEASPSSMLSRAGSKASKMYKFRGRDLVDTAEDNEEIIEELDDEVLPDAMKGMTVDERKAHVNQHAATRKEIQTKITEATKARNKFIASKRKEMAEATGEATLGDAMSAAVVRQLKEAGFEMTNQ